MIGKFIILLYIYILFIGMFACLNGGYTSTGSNSDIMTSFSIVFYSYKEEFCFLAEKTFLLELTLC